MMERRAFISAVGAFLGVTTFAVEAQPAGARRIGFLNRFLPEHVRRRLRNQIEAL